MWMVDAAGRVSGRLVAGPTWWMWEGSSKVHLRHRRSPVYCEVPVCERWLIVVQNLRGPVSTLSEERSPMWQRPFVGHKLEYLLSKLLKPNRRLLHWIVPFNCKSSFRCWYDNYDWMTWIKGRKVKRMYKKRSRSRLWIEACWIHE